jgi:SpoU rRNA methylase family enzyme
VATAPTKPGHGLERILIVLLGAAAGFTLCGAILQKSEPLMVKQDVYFFSVVAAILFAGLAWKFS